MPETDAAIIKVLKSKITKLVKVVLDEATANEEFRLKLESVFGEDAPVAKPAKTATRTVKASKAKETFNHVSFLQEHGNEKLAAELSLKTDTELKAILRKEKIRNTRELNKMERQQMIDEILQDAESRLGGGTSFLR